MDIPNETPGMRDMKANNRGRDAQFAIDMYTRAKSDRTPYEDDLRLAAMHCLPSQYGRWGTETAPTTSIVNAGVKTARRLAYDSTGMLSLPKYKAMLTRLATPPNQMYHVMLPGNERQRRRRRTVEYYHSVNNMLHKRRHAYDSGFGTMVQATYAQLGVYGSGPMFIGRRNAQYGDAPGVLYKTCPLVDCFVVLDDDGRITHWFRRLWLTVKTYERTFPGAALPTCMKSMTTPLQQATEQFEFVHWVRHRLDDVNPAALDARRFRYVSDYVCVKDREFVGEQEGYKSMPYRMPRADVVDGSAYGISPALRALGALGTASAITKTLLQHGQRAATPTLLTHDDANLNGENPYRPGAIVYGGLTRTGSELYKPLRVGDPRFGESMLADQRRAIEDSFFVNLFNMLQENPRMTATEVLGREAERAALLAPTITMLQNELIAPMLAREIEVLEDLGAIPPMPGEMQEDPSSHSFDVIYTSPMAKAVYAEETTAFLRLYEFVERYGAATRDPGVFDFFDLETAIPQMAENMAVPPSWLLDPETRAARADARQQQQAATTVAENASGLAALSTAV